MTEDKTLVPNLAAASVALSVAELAQIDDFSVEHPVAGARYGSADLARVDGGSGA
jgi:hypothetical protein